MKFFETSKYHSFKKSTYIALRWIGIIGQLIAVNFVYFILNFKFDFITSNLVIFLGIISNLYLTFVYQKTQYAFLVDYLWCPQIYLQAQYYYTVKVKI